MFIDNFLHYTEVVLLNRKDKTLDAFKKFVVCAENKLGRHIVCFRSDGGSVSVGWKDDASFR